MRAILCAGVIALSASALQAQTLRPESRSEAQSNTINNSLATQGQNRNAIQQNQFEINSLRNQPPPAILPPPQAGVPQR